MGLRGHDLLFCRVWGHRNSPREGFCDGTKTFSATAPLKPSSSLGGSRALVINTVLSTLTGVMIAYDYSGLIYNYSYYGLIYNSSYYVR